jgi:hypothetical protein
MNADSCSYRTLKITGGETFVLYLSKNPPVHHDGVLSLHQLYLSDEELSSVGRLVLGFGSNLQVVGPVLQTPDQLSDRVTLLGIGSEFRVWPSKLCMDCSWLDPLMENPCGRASWPKESVESFLEMEKPKTDLSDCTAKHVWDPLSFLQDG